MMRLRSCGKYLITALLIITLMLPVAWHPQTASAYSGSTVQLLLYPGENTVFLNGQPVRLDVPAQVIGGRMYVPLKFLGDTIGFQVSWDGETRKTLIRTDKAEVEISEEEKKMWVNGKEQPLGNVALIRGGRLLAQVVWFTDLTDAKTVYNSELNRVEITYVSEPQQLKEVDPIARFALSKSVYRIGEPVQYIDLSYHPNGTGIVERHWGGRRDAFFRPGRYPVTLRVVDRNGHESAVYTKEVVVADEVMHTEMEYQLHYSRIGSIIRAEGQTSRSYFNTRLPVLNANIRQNTDRKLLVSNSPETFRRTGLLYQDSVNGKARLYMTHVNGLDRPAQVMILATNHGQRPVTVTTTNKGEVAPSLYTHLIGREATFDYLVRDSGREVMQIDPGETAVYAVMPTFMPGQGANAFYDVESNREVEFSFVAVEDGTRNVRPHTLPKLEYDRHVRGTFEASDLTWSLSGSSITGTSRLIIGDNEYDRFVSGYDPFRQEFVHNYGNYGVIYTIRISNPGKMAVLLLARGGGFAGPFRVGDQFIEAPASGVLTPYDGAYLLARTTGMEDVYEIEFSPPSGSAFPIDLIFVPLDGQ